MQKTKINVLIGRWLRQHILTDSTTLLLERSGHDDVVAIDGQVGQRQAVNVGHQLKFIATSSGLRLGNWNRIIW